MPDIFESEEKKANQPEVQLKAKKKSPQTVFDKDYGIEIPARFLASFYFKPRMVDFENRQRQEKVIMLLRKHPITNLRWIIVVLAMAAAPVLLKSFPLLSFLPASYQLIAVLAWYLITTAFALEGFLTWFFNVHLVTDERIVDIDFQNLIYKEVSDASIDRVQDVTTRMGGAARTVFDFGDVFIQTAAEEPKIEFLSVPKPAKVARVMRDLCIEEEVEKMEGRVR